MSQDISDNGLTTDVGPFVISGRAWTAETADAAAAVLATEGTPMDDHRASSSFRRAMLGQSVRKFFVETEQAQQLGGAA